VTKYCQKKKKDWVSLYFKILLTKLHFFRFLCLILISYDFNGLLNKVKLSKNNENVNSLKKTIFFHKNFKYKYKSYIFVFSLNIVLFNITSCYIKSIINTLQPNKSIVFFLPLRFIESNDIHDSIFYTLLLALISVPYFVLYLRLYFYK